MTSALRHEYGKVQQNSGATHVSIYKTLKAPTNIDKINLNNPSAPFPSLGQTIDTDMLGLWSSRHPVGCHAVARLGALHNPNNLHSCA